MVFLSQDRVCQSQSGHRECLSVVDGVIMKGSCIVIPASLRAKTLDTLHNSHMGEIKTIECARTVLFWPKMENNIIAHLSFCHPCAKFEIKKKPEPLSHNVPIVPWHSLSLDNFEWHTLLDSVESFLQIYCC